MSQYFPKPYEPFRGDINIKVHLSICPFIIIQQKLMMLAAC